MGKPSWKEAVSAASIIRETIAPKSVEVDGIEVLSEPGAPLTLKNAVVSAYWQNAPEVLPLAAVLSDEDRQWWDAVHDIEQQYVRLGAPLPARFEEPRPTTPGRSPLEHVIRDLAIVGTVQLLVHLGFNATRNDSRGENEACEEGRSACDAVGVAFGMTFKNVKRIWVNATPETRLRMEIEVWLKLLHAMDSVKQVAQPNK